MERFPLQHPCSEYGPGMDGSERERGGFRRSELQVHPTSVSFVPVPETTLYHVPGSKASVSLSLGLWSLTYEEELTTPLHVAASRGHTEVLQLLLKRRAKPDSAPGGRTALHEACTAGHTACVRVLLVAGADPNIPDQDGKRPLHLCRGPGILE